MPAFRHTGTPSSVRSSTPMRDAGRPASPASEPVPRQGPRLPRGTFRASARRAPRHPGPPHFAGQPVADRQSASPMPNGNPRGARRAPPTLLAQDGGQVSSWPGDKICRHPSPNFGRGVRRHGTARGAARVPCARQQLPRAGGPAGPDPRRGCRAFSPAIPPDRGLRRGALMKRPVAGQLRTGDVLRRARLSASPRADGTSPIRPAIASCPQAGEAFLSPDDAGKAKREPVPEQRGWTAALRTGPGWVSRLPPAKWPESGDPDGRRHRALARGAAPGRAGAVWRSPGIFSDERGGDEAAA